jgi:quercetin dioxygenase-like cupin family protein
MKMNQAAWIGVLVVGLAGVAGADAAKPAAKPAGLMTSASELTWKDVPGFPIKTAVTWGDPAAGAHGAFHKFPAGFEAPLHHHTSDHNVVVVSGTMTLTPEGGAAKTLPPGSFFSFTGMKKHGTKCEPGADCVLYMEAAGKWDVILPEAKPAAK